MLARFKKLLSEIRRIIVQPVMSVLPGQLAFFFVLSIPPLVSLVGIICNAFSISTEKFISFINTSFPASTSSLIIPIINGRGLSLGILFFIFGALAMVSNGTNAIVVTSNMLYNIDNKNSIKKRIKSIFLVFIIVLLLAFIIVVPAFGSVIISMLKNVSYMKNIFSELLFIYNILELPISFIFIYFVIKLIYTIAPDANIKSRDVTYGALFTTILWIGSTEVFSYYVTHFAKYDVFYGSIANLIILLLWIYLLSYIFVLGMALNASTYSRELKNKKGS